MRWQRKACASVGLTPSRCRRFAPAGRSTLAGGPGLSGTSSGGQERDRFRPKLGVPEDQIRQRTVPGNDANMVDKVRQHLANTQDRKTEEDWFAPRLFTRGMDFLEQAEDGQPFFLVIDSFDPH